MNRVAIAVVVLLCGCTPPLAEVPGALRTCPPRPATPAALPKIYTTGMLRQFAVKLELAREAERARGDACADGLDRLVAWLDALRRR